MDISKLLPTLKDYEKLSFAVRRHPITFLPKIGLFFFLLAFPWLLFFILRLANPDIFLTQAMSVVTVLTVSAVSLIALALFLTHFVDYYLDVWVITNERIVDILQSGLFSRTVAETRFYLIQDVTTEVKGFLPTIFNYGNIYIQTSGTVERFILYEVPHPNTIARRIMELVDEDKKHHEGKIKLLNLENQPRIMDSR